MLKGDGNAANNRRAKLVKGQDSPCHKIIKMAMEHDLVPVIVFSFSKKDCETYALQMSKLDFNTGNNDPIHFVVFALIVIIFVPKS